MNHTLSDSQLEEMIKSAVNSSGPLPPDEKFSLLISALRELQERRKAAMNSEPAPVVPGEITSASAPEVFEIAAEAELLGLRGTYASYAVGWNACRSAMLNGGKS
ncbi:hypothetical protein ACXEGP_002438 [Klebsiella quasipneumoniae]